MTLLDVGDFLVASREAPAREWLKNSLSQRLQFGKCEPDEADFLGRRLKVTQGKVEISQAKYIIEEVRPVVLGRGRRSRPRESLSSDEFQTFQGLVYKLNWLGRETRPECAGVASIMSSRLPHATVFDILLVKKLVAHLRVTAQQKNIIW
eukprot:4961847-Alexandrium_andersonii.AAC.1